MRTYYRIKHLPEYENLLHVPGPPPPRINEGSRRSAVTSTLSSGSHSPTPPGTPNCSNGGNTGNGHGHGNGNGNGNGAQRGHNGHRANGASREDAFGFTQIDTEGSIPDATVEHAPPESNGSHKSSKGMFTAITAHSRPSSL